MGDLGVYLGVIYGVLYDKKGPQVAHFYSHWYNLPERRGDGIALTGVFHIGYSSRWRHSRIPRILWRVVTGTWLTFVDQLCLYRSDCPVKVTLSIFFLIYASTVDMCILQTAEVTPSIWSFYILFFLVGQGSFALYIASISTNVQVSRYFWLLSFPEPISILRSVEFNAYIGDVVDGTLFSSLQNFPPKHNGKIVGLYLMCYGLSAGWSLSLPCRGYSLILWFSDFLILCFFWFRRCIKHFLPTSVVLFTLLYDHVLDNVVETYLFVMAIGVAISSTVVCNQTWMQPIMMWSQGTNIASCGSQGFYFLEKIPLDEEQVATLRSCCRSHAHYGCYHRHDFFPSKRFFKFRTTYLLTFSNWCHNT